MVLSLIAHFWSQFLTNFDVTPLKSKLRISSTSIWSNQEAHKVPRNGKNMSENCRHQDICWPRVSILSNRDIWDSLEPSWLTTWTILVRVTLRTDWCWLDVRYPLFYFSYWLKCENIDWKINPKTLCFVLFFLPGSKIIHEYYFWKLWKVSADVQL